MALTALAAMMTATLAAGGPTAIVRNWPAGDAAAVVLVIGLHPEEAALDKSGAEALLAEMMMLQVSREFQQKTGAAAPLAKAMPSGRNIEVDRQREYMTVTIDVVDEGVPAAIGFLRQTILESKWTDDDLGRAESAVIARRTDWIGQVVTQTDDLMLRALVGDPMAIGYFGSVQGTRNVTLADLAALRAHLLTKGNVRLSVEAPDATDNKAIAAALEAFVAKLPEGVGHKARAPWVGGKVEVADNPNVDRASVAVGFPVAPFGKREYWAACILREMLAGSGGTLVEDKQLPARLGITVGGAAEWKDWPMQPLEIQVGQRPYLAVHAVCAAEAIDDARDAALDHMKGLAAGRFSDDKLWRARRRVANGWARDLSPLGQRAELRGIAALSGADLPDVKAVTALVNAVPKAMLQSVAQDMIAHAAVGVQMPRD